MTARDKLLAVLRRSGYSQQRATDLVAEVTDDVDELRREVDLLTAERDELRRRDNVRKMLDGGAS